MSINEFSWHEESERRSEHSLLPIPRDPVNSVNPGTDPHAGVVFHDSNSVRGIPDCRMMDCKVPILISRCSGTGTVMVPIDCFFCITIWLPRLRTSLNPCFSKIVHTSLPERIRSLPNGDLDLCHKNVSGKSTVYFFGRSCLKK